MPISIHSPLPQDRTQYSNQSTLLTLRKRLLRTLEYLEPASVARVHLDLHLWSFTKTIAQTVTQFDVLQLTGYQVCPVYPPNRKAHLSRRQHRTRNFFLPPQVISLLLHLSRDQPTPAH